jgi:hypothetical protein
MATETLDKNKMTPEQMAEWATTPEGQSAIRARQTKGKSPHTAKEIEKLTRMAESYESKYIRIDSKTKQPMEEAKDFFWRIVSFIPAMADVLGSSAEIEHLEGNIRINFLIQKFYRDPKLMYEAKTDASNPHSPTRKIHAAFVSRRRDGSLLESGDRLIDGSDFLEQFKKETEEE